MKPQNLAESIVWYTIIYTYVIYLVGGLYIVGPAIAWLLLAYLCYRLWKQDADTPEAEKISIPWIIWVWIAGMLLEEVALIVGHLDFQMSNIQIIKSSVGWAKGWALLALFPLAGCLKIRPQLLYRAVCIVGLHSLLLAPFLYLAYVAGLQEVLYTSPLKIFGGAGNLFFLVGLYTIDSEGAARWLFFCPWGPAAGLVGNVYFFMALQEKNPKWRWLGIAGSLVLCYMSKSRLATLCLVLIVVGTWVLGRLVRPLYLMLFGLAAAIAGLAAPVIADAATSYWINFRSSRASSTRVREALQRIALERWWNEAPIWGHGVVQQGPHLVEYMPIGSHHTVFALLFVKGIVGLIAFAVPMILTILDLLIKAQDSQTVRVGLSIALILAFYAFGENLEVLAYLYWPGLVAMGIALKEEPEPVG